MLGADPVDGGFTERGRIRVRVRCRTESGPCRVTLAAPRARRSARIGPGRTVVRLRLALARKTRRAVHRHPRRGVRVKLTLRGRDVAGLTARTTRRVRVRARPAP